MAAIAALWLVAAVSVPAAALVVSNNGDAGAGSLRDMIASATSGDTITFAGGLDGGLITLLTGHLLLTNNLTIDASALSAGIAISGNSASRIFQVEGGSSVTLTHLTVRDGWCGFTDAGAGLLVYSSTVVMNEMAFTQNHGDAVSSFGGAVSSFSGVLTINNSSIYSNSASAGGGIWSSGVLTVNNTTVTENSAIDGGGIRRLGVSSFTLNHSTVAGNTATGTGGGIDMHNPITLWNSIVADNVCATGPDIYNGSSYAITKTGVSLVGSTSGSGVTAGPNLLVARPCWARWRTTAGRPCRWRCCRAVRRSMWRGRHR
ncbi:MAG: hypothetical protein HQ523_06785 [Lentisphaerae bacterium]|nr:hypothetical protein [Lentisphaerota bacterium]